MLLQLNLLSIINFKFFIKSSLFWLIFKISSKKITVSFWSKNIRCFSEIFIFIFLFKLRRSVNLLLKIFYKRIIIVLVLIFCIYWVCKFTISCVSTEYPRFLFFILPYERKVTSWIFIIQISEIILVLDQH
jgi:hypothetical protein